MDCSSQPTSTFMSLKHDLFCNYDATVLPPTKNSSSTGVYITLVLQFIQFQEAGDLLRFHVWMDMDWSDERLTWDPAAYSSLSHITTDKHELWFPDIMLYSASQMDRSIPFPENVSCDIQHTGSVSCSAAVALSGRCHVDARNWPYDVHTCQMSVGSQAHTGGELDVLINNEPMQLYRFQQNQEWHMAEMSVTRRARKYDKESYPWLEYAVTLERHATGHSAVAVVPAIVLVVLAMSSFCVEPECSERILLCVSNVACHIIYMLYVMYLVPVNTDNTPLLLRFYVDSVLLASLTVVFSVVMYGIATRTCVPSTYVSNYAKRISNSVLGKFLLPEGCTFQVNNTNEDGQRIQEVQASCDRNVPLEWRIVAAFVDRVIFILYVFVIVILLYKLII